MRSDVQTKEEFESLITVLEKDLNELNEKREQIQKRITELKQQRHLLIKQNPSDSTSQANQPSVTNHSSESHKIALFRSLFRGREDVFARRFESAKTGKSGYQSCCRNEWIHGICQKPAIKCTDCSNRDFTPVTDGIINFSSLANKNHCTACQIIISRFSRMIRRHRVLFQQMKSIGFISLIF
jgi:hypothetical protein